MGIQEVELYEEVFFSSSHSIQGNDCFVKNLKTFSKISEDLRHEYWRDLSNG